MMHIPDKWTAIKITTPEGETQRRVFACWYGGYCGSDSWQLSSAAVSEEDRGDYVDFHNQSGSVYRCYKHAQGMSGYGRGVYESLPFNKEEGWSVEVIHYEVPDLVWVDGNVDEICDTGTERLASALEVDEELHQKYDF